MSIRLGLLALLAEEPKHGYQLKTEFESATGGVWKLNVGQVYTTLDRLVRDRAVVVEIGGGDGAAGGAGNGEAEQKRYRLTAEGREELAAWWSAIPGEEPPPRDELVVKVLLAVATAPDLALDVITGQRTALTEVLQRRRRAQRAEVTSAHSDAPSALVARLASDALVVRTEADLRWLDLCEARVLAARQPGQQSAHHSPSGGRSR